MEHSFNTEIAQKYGIHEAILYNHFLFWITKNKANGKNYHDGRYWTYTSIKALQEIFNYLSEKQIRSAIKKLIDNKILIKANYNSNPYDRTSWYAFNEEPAELSKIQQAGGQMKKPEGKNVSNLGDSYILPEGQMKKPEGENVNTDILTDTLTDTLTNKSVCTHTHALGNSETQEKSDQALENCIYSTPKGLLNSSYPDFEAFKQAYLCWFVRLTGKPVNDILQTAAAGKDTAMKFDWLFKNFKRRTVNAGAAIFDTLEYIARDKTCKNNYRFRAADYLDGVISRLVDPLLAKTDPVRDEGKGRYKDPTFDYFKY